MRRSRSAGFAVMVCVLASAAAGCGQHASVRTDAAWVRGADSAATTAAYFTLVNDRDDTLHVTGISGDAANAISMHETVHVGAMASMRELAFLDVPPHARIAFAPGGRHVMLEGLSRALEPGMHVNLVLHASGWPEVPIVAEVRR